MSAESGSDIGLDRRAARRAHVWEWIRKGVSGNTVIAVSSLILGLFYGAACVANGVSPAVAVFSSFIVFSGAVQFGALGLIAQPEPYLAVAVSALLLATRFILQGASIRGHLRAHPLTHQLAAAPILSDGNWATTIALDDRAHKLAFFVAAGLYIQASWAVGTLAGALAADLVDEDVRAALQFSGVVFLILLLLMIEQKTKIGHAPWLISAVIAAAMSLIAPTALAFGAGAAAGGAYAALRRRPA